MEEDRFRNISSGSIAILGSGETSPNLLGVHRTMIDRLENIKNPLLLDSPFGFQENVNQLSTKLKEFFMKSLSLDIDMVSYRTTNEMGSVEYFKCLERISKSNFLFAGPGSPSYAIKVWRDTEFPEHFISLLKNDGSLVFSSAAATTLGEYTLPVYEIYKVGEEPYWSKGLNILSAFNIKATIIPHFNNKEGGNHDTRFCYMGKTRFDKLRNSIDSLIIGVDEHTGLVIDGKSRLGEVYGIGKVTLISNNNEVEYSVGSQISFDEISKGKENKVIPIKKEVEVDYEKKTSIEEASNLIGKDSINRESINRVLGQIKLNIEELESKTEIIDPLIELVIEIRKELRLSGKFELSDHIRSKVEELGIEINDKDSESSWKFKA